MKYLSILILLSVLTSASAIAGGSGGGSTVGEAEGLAIVSPIKERSCIALRVDVPEGKALSGIQWFNGSSDQAFPRVLVASGTGDLPPVYDSAIVMAEGVTGQENAMSELAFSEPISSQSGSLFVVLQFPAFYIPPEDGISMGVGFREFEGENNYYLSSDGDKWFRLSSNYDFLLTPLYADWDPSFISLSSPAEDGPELDEDAIPLPTKTSFEAYPNPFNPETNLKLELREQASCEVIIFDLKGRVVRKLHSGNLPAGTTVLVWNGRDNSGRTLSSGVYWVRAVLGDLSFSKRLVMIK